MRAWKSVLILTFAISAVAKATTTVPMDRVCPVGGETYKSFEIASTSSFGMMLDLRPIGPAAFLPQIECPNGFIVFKEEGDFTPDEIAKLTPLVATAAFQEARAQEVPSVRLVMEEKAIGAKLDTIAYFTLKSAFEAEQNQNETLHQKYLEEAATAYSAFLNEHPVNDKAGWVAKIRLAEIDRQRGQFDQAVAVVDALGNPPSDAAWLADVAVQIRTAALAKESKPLRFTPPGSQEK